LKNTITLFLLCILFITCKPIYITSDFDFASSPEAPDYSDNKDWAVLPSQWPKELEEVVGPHIKKEADVGTPTSDLPKFEMKFFQRQ
jgi:hypothetical protein